MEKTTTITSIKRSYVTPTVPVTPSKRINDFLQKHCNRYFFTTLPYLVARIVCAIMALLVRVYSALSDDRKPSRLRWTVACLLVGILCGLCTYYNAVFNLLYYAWLCLSGSLGSYIAYNVTEYGCLFLGWVAVVLAAVCIVAY